MTDAQRENALRRLVQRIEPGARLLRAWPLTGGVSAQLTGLEVERPDGQLARLIVRRHGAVDLNRNLRIARDEYRLLRFARSHGLPVPTAYDFDESCDLLPTPFLIVELVDGDTEFAPADLAAYLAQAAGNPPDLSFLPALDARVGDRPAVLDVTLGEARIRDALEAARPLSRANPACLLHGDYWPGNILWKDGHLVAVVDWEDAHLGDPLADLANCRLELLWSFGPDAMAAFTDHYRGLTSIDFTNLPYWDLRAALRPCSQLSGWGLDAATERRMREQHHLFVTQAIAALPAD